MVALAPLGRQFVIVFDSAAGPLCMQGLFERAAGLVHSSPEGPVIVSLWSQAGKSYSGLFHQGTMTALSLGLHALK